VSGPFDVPALLDLGGADLATTVARAGVDPAGRCAVDGYGSLAGLDVIGVGSGVLVYVRGDQVVVVHVTPKVLGDDVDHDALLGAVDDEHDLPAAVDKSAHVHVVADRGLAWTERRGEVLAVELFPATDLEGYVTTLYHGPPPDPGWR
jgi:hypothetical protein